MLTRRVTPLEPGVPQKLLYDNAGVRLKRSDSELWRMGAPGSQESATVAIGMIRMVAIVSGLADVFFRHLQ